MTKFIKSGKYDISLDVAEAHMIEQALKYYGNKGGQGPFSENFETYIDELRTKVNTVYERHAQEVNKRK